MILIVIVEHVLVPNSYTQNRQPNVSVTYLFGLVCTYWFGWSILKQKLCLDMFSFTDDFSECFYIYQTFNVVKITKKLLVNSIFPSGYIDHIRSGSGWEYLWNDFEGCVRYFFARLFCMSKREHLWNKKCFLFHVESSFHSWDNQILTFEMLICHDVIKCSSMKHETHFVE